MVPSAGTSCTILRHPYGFKECRGFCDAGLSRGSVILSLSRRTMWYCWCQVSPLVPCNTSLLLFCTAQGSGVSAKLSSFDLKLPRINSDGSQSRTLRQRLESQPEKSKLEQANMVGETAPRGGTATVSRGKSATNGHRVGSPAAVSPLADRSRPRTPASISAINDGRSLLASFRTNKRNREATAAGSPAATATAAAPSVHSSSNGNGSSGPSAGKSTADKGIVDYLDRFQPPAPGLVRNLEAALDASVPVQRPSEEEGKVGRVVDHGDGAGVANAGGKASGSSSHRGTSSPSGGAVGPSGADDGGGNSGISSGGGASVATATAAAATTAGKAAVAVAAADSDAATAASKPSAPEKNIERNDWESPARLTPEMVRQAARTSQAAFLSSVLPTEDLDFQTTTSNGHAFPSQQSQPVTLNGRHGSPSDSALPRQSGTTGGSWSGGAVTAAPGAALSSSDAAGSMPSDRQAAARWASMRRLQEQSVGLGSAADHQLARALQLCRDLRGLKTGIGGGNLSGHERASRLEALQSTLHGLEEVLSKRALTDKAAGVEAESLGGPAVVTSLLNGVVGNEDDAAIRAAAAAGRVNGAKAEAGTSAAGGGWLSGSQLKAFEEQVQARSSMEITALQSERRKLRSKVEMFQRQVQLLQREGATHSPAPAIVGMGRTGDSVGVGEADSGGGFGSAAGEKRFADLLDARLGEERHLKATLEAELASLRGSLEEKEGLIGALREALRSSATPAAENGAAVDASAATQVDPAGSPAVGPEEGTTTAAATARRGVAAENSGAPHSVDSGAAVPGRGAFAPRSSDSGGGSRRGRGRYHSRSSQFLSAQGMAEAAATGAAAGGNARENEQTRGEGDQAGFTRGGEYDGDRATVVAGGAATAPDTSDSDAEVSSELGAGFAHGNGGEYPSGASAAGFGAASLAAGARGQGGSSGALAGGASGKSMARRERHSDGDGRAGIISQATAVTGTALRMLWDSARLVGSRAGVDGGGSSDSPAKTPRQRGTSSHAVLIL